MIKNILILFSFILFYSCSKDACYKNSGDSFANVNYREWDLGLSNFQFGTIANNALYNEGNCEDFQYLRIFLYRYSKREDGSCRLSGEIVFDSIPIIFNEKINIPSQCFYILLDADVDAERYQFKQLPGFESFVRLTKEDNNCEKIYGEFQASFVFNDTHKLLDINSPDTLFFTNGTFESENFF